MHKAGHCHRAALLEDGNTVPEDGDMNLFAARVGGLIEVVHKFTMAMTRQHGHDQYVLLKTSMEPALVGLTRLVPTGPSDVISPKDLSSLTQVRKRARLITDCAQTVGFYQWLREQMVLSPTMLHKEPVTSAMSGAASACTLEPIAAATEWKSAGGPKARGQLPRRPLAWILLVQPSHYCSSPTQQETVLFK